MDDDLRHLVKAGIVHKVDSNKRIFAASAIQARTLPKVAAPPAREFLRIASVPAMTRSARSARRRTSVRRPAVIFQPSALLTGIHLMVNAVKPTLGPLPRFVGIESSIRDRPPELLDNAAVIARRIIQVAHPTADVGAMMMRHALWRMHEVCGDGAATMAVIAQAILKQADKAIAAGRHPTLIRHGIEQGVKQATAQLSAAIIRPAGGRQARDLLMALARTSCSDSDLRDILVEVVSIIGANGAVQVVNHNGRGVEREYIEGALWDSPWLTTGFATEHDQSVARLTDGAVVLLDGKLDAAEDVLQGCGGYMSWLPQRADRC